MSKLDNVLALVKLATEVVDIKAKVAHRTIRNKLNGEVHKRQFDKLEKSLTKVLNKTLRSQVKLAVRMVEKSYETELESKMAENQPRDSHGRFSSTNSSGSSTEITTGPDGSPMLSQKHQIYGSLDGMTPHHAKVVLKTLEKLADKYGLPEHGLKIQTYTSADSTNAQCGAALITRVPKGSNEEVEARKNNVQVVEESSQSDNVYIFDRKAAVIRCKVKQVIEEEDPETQDFARVPAMFGASPEAYNRHKSDYEGFHPASPKSAAEDTIAHEYGHVLSAMKLHSEISALGPAIAGRADVLGILASYPAPPLADKISGYAHANLAETIAEGFMMYENGGSRDPELVAFLRDHIDLKEGQP